MREAVDLGFWQGEKKWFTLGPKEAVIVYYLTTQTSSRRSTLRTPCID